MEEFSQYKLKLRQALPLEQKIMLTKKRIEQWYNYYSGEVYVAFSGGKDSTVLLDLVRSMYPEVPAVFSDTGLEYPEIRDFVKAFDNVIWVKPKKTFKEVVLDYGYPVISKKVSRYVRDCRNPTSKNKQTVKLRLTGIKGDGKKAHSSSVLSKKWRFLIDAPFNCSEECCGFIKKQPLKTYAKKSGKTPFIGVMADESEDRALAYNQNGCNAFNSSEPQSRPIMFWKESDIWEYLKTKNIPYSKIYDMGEKRTGCMFCMFGIMYDGVPNRFQRMAKTHPKQYKYCMENLGLKEVLEYIGVPYENNQLEFDLEVNQ